MTTPQINLPRYGNIFINADTFADLRSIPTTKIIDGYSAIVAGAHAPADGLGGLLVWSAVSTAADDDLTVIAPADGGHGRWLKIAVGVVGPQGSTGNTGPQGQQGAIGGNVMAIGSFAASAGSIIPAGANLVRTSSFATGSTSGSASYIYDATVNTAFVAANKAASFLTADGRGFRLAEPTITPEMFGAIGDGVTNDQPAIQACLDWAAVAGVTHVRFNHLNYALWCPLRTTTAYTDYNTDGIPMVVRSSMLMEPLGAHTTLKFLSHEGLDRSTHWQTPPTPGNQMWRGGGIYIVGDVNQPAIGTPLKVEYFTMRNMTLDGGIEATGYRGDPNGNSGKGWDQTDKGFRLQDQIAGDFTLENVEITRFSGELLYGGATSRSMTTKNCHLHNTDGDAYNWANTARVLDIGSRWGKAYQPIEGFGGPGMRLIGTEMYDCVTGGGIEGGRIGGLHNADGSTVTNTTYSEAQRFDPDIIPWIELDDVQINNCGGAFYVSNWIRGTIRTTDTSIYVSSDMQRTSTCVDLDISVTADKKNLGNAVFLSGPQSTTTPYNGGPRFYEPPSNIHLVIRCGQSENAVANNIMCQRPFEWNGLTGKNVTIILDDCVAVHSESTNSPSVKTMPYIERKRVITQDGVVNTTLSNVGSNNALRFVGPTVSFSAGGSTTGDYPVTVDAVGFADGQLVDVTWFGGGSTMTFAKGAGVILQGSSLQLANNQKATFRYSANNNAWMYVSTYAFSY